MIYLMYLGEDIAFIYPDLETALVGKFDKGKTLLGNVELCLRMYFIKTLEHHVLHPGLTMGSNVDFFCPNIYGFKIFNTQ